MSSWKKVTEQYFGHPVGDGQNPDWPGTGVLTPDAVRIAGRGSESGGSKASRNPGRKGSGKLSNSAPKSPQKLRR